MQVFTHPVPRSQQPQLRALVEVHSGRVVIRAIADSDEQVERVEREIKEAFRRELERDSQQ